jgi:nitrite reductase (NADH) small subunit
MSGASWQDVCALDDIPDYSGVAALVDGKQVALIRLAGEQVFALSNYDPFSQAFVISRGIVGDRDGTPKIASPIFKQSFALHTGVCLDDPMVVLPSYPVRVHRGRVQVASQSAADQADQAATPPGEPAVAGTVRAPSGERTAAEPANGVPATRRIRAA